VRCDSSRPVLTARGSLVIFVEVVFGVLSIFFENLWCRGRKSQGQKKPRVSGDIEEKQRCRTTAGPIRTCGISVSESALLMANCSGKGRILIKWRQ